MDSIARARGTLAAVMLSIACAVMTVACSAPAETRQAAGTVIGCVPCSAADAAQDFTLAAAEQGLRHGVGSTALCANVSCAHAPLLPCWPLRLAPCSALTRSQRFLNYTGPGGNSCPPPKNIVADNGHALDYGVYCPGCHPQVGLAQPAAVPWEQWTVDDASNARCQMGWGSDTGSITVTTAGTFRFWPQGGLAGPMALRLTGVSPVTMSKSGDPAGLIAGLALPESALASAAGG